MTPGFHHVAIIGSDLAATRAFYSDVLGLTLIRETRRQERGDVKLDYRLGDGELEVFVAAGHPARPDRPEAYGLRHLALTVPDLQEAIAEVTEAGAVCEPIRTDPLTGHRTTFLKDPDGLPIELVEI